MCCCVAETINILKQLKIKYNKNKRNKEKLLQEAAFLSVLHSEERSPGLGISRVAAKVWVQVFNISEAQFPHELGGQAFWHRGAGSSLFAFEMRLSPSLTMYL